MTTTPPSLGVITTDRQLTVRSWNDWVAAATGVPEAQAVGRPLMDFVDAGRGEFYRELFAEVLERGTTRVLAPAFHKYLIACPPREPAAHFTHMRQRITVAPLAADAATVGVMITLEDVTERMDRERAVAAAIPPSPGPHPREAGAALASDDWRVRGAAVRHLQRSATVEEVRHLVATLQRDHHDLNVLNSALRVLIGSGRAVIEPLVEMLSDEQPNLRMHAALALGELHAQEAAPKLVTALEDPDENVQFHAIEALGRLGTPESVVPLAKIAASGNFFLAFAAVEALGKTDDGRVAPLMVSLLDQQLLRPAAIETLAAIGDEDCVPALVRALNQTDGPVGPIASALVRVHARYEDGGEAGTLIVDKVRRTIDAAGCRALAAASARDDVHRADVVAVLGWLGRVSIDPLIALVGDPAVHATVVEGLVAAGADAVPLLIERLGSASPEARVAAAHVLGRIGDRRALAALLQALEDADAEVVAEAASSLGLLGDAAAVDALFALFVHPSAAVRRAAVAAVTIIGDAGTTARAQAAMRASQPRMRECAVRVAGYFGYADCVAAVLQALRDADEGVRRAAIEQLPILDDVDAAAELRAALTSETPRNRAAAAHALRLVEDPRAGVALHAALNDADPWVRYYAATSLGDARFGSAAADDLARLAQHDPATHVRIAAIGALGAMHGVLAARVAAALIADEDDELAIAAVDVLGGARRRDAHEWLTRAAQSHRPAVRLAGIRALARRPHQDSVETLSWAARAGDDPDAPVAAINALSHIAATASGHPAAQRAAVGALRELAAEGTARREVIAALARLPEELVPEVASGLSAGRVAARVATADVLAAMRHPRASGELARALRDEDPAVRGAAISGFGKLGTPAVARTIAAMRHHDPDAGVRRRAELVCARHGWGGGPSPRS